MFPTLLVRSQSLTVRGDMGLEDHQTGRDNSLVGPLKINQVGTRAKSVPPTTTGSQPPIRQGWPSSSSYDNGSELKQSL